MKVCKLWLQHVEGGKVSGAPPSEAAAVGLDAEPNPPSLPVSEEIASVGVKPRQPPIDEISELVAGKVLRQAPAEVAEIKFNKGDAEKRLGIDQTQRLEDDPPPTLFVKGHCKSLGDALKRPFQLATMSR